MTQTFYCTVCKYPEESLTNIKRIRPFVDGAIVIHQYPANEQFVEQFNQLRTDLYQAEFNDDFGEFRNHYLDKVAEITADKNDTWILSNDCDEFPSNKFLKFFKALIDEPGDKNTISFNCHEVIIKNTNNDDAITFIARSPDTIRQHEVISHSISGFYKDLLFKYSDNIKYIGKLNATITGTELKRVQADKECYYIHMGTEMDIKLHNARNFFIGGGENPDTIKKWQELRAITDMHGYSTWELLDQAMRDGNLPSELKQFFLANKSTELPGDVKLGSYYDYCIFLNPQEDFTAINIDKPASDKGVTDKLQFHDTISQSTMRSAESKPRNTDNKLRNEDNKPRNVSTTYRPTIPEHVTKNVIDEMEKFVEDAYMKILCRPADDEGKNLYTKLLKSGKVEKEYLYTMLRNSEEYKSKKMVT